MSREFFIRHSPFEFRHLLRYHIHSLKPRTIHQAASMKITAVKTIPLGGVTHDHGWPGGTDPNVQYNTLVEVVADSGLVGLGSCYTTRALVEGSLTLLREHLLGESALMPERVSEKLRQAMF